MSQITLEIEGHEVLVDEGFLSMSPEQQGETVDEIAQSLGVSSGPNRNRFMGQVNAGIGSVVDLLNPFDTPAVSQALGMGDRLSTGSAVDMMNAAGIPAATKPPEGFAQGFGRGVGEAAASAPLVAGGAAALKNVGGMVGNVADDALAVLSTRSGVAGEATAGGVAQGASEAAETAGAPEWVQNTAAVAAPMGAAGALAGAYKAAPYTLIPTAARRVRAELAPFTKAGATDVARQRIQSLAGGRDRAEQLAGRIGGENPLGLTPAQQTNDQNLLAVEQMAASQDPLLRADLDGRQNQTQTTASQQITPEGNPDDALTFFEARRSEFKADMAARVTRAQGEADAALSGIQGQRSESDNSLAAMANIDTELRLAKDTEAQLWAAVDGAAIVPTSASKSMASEWRDKLGRAKAGDMPKVARQLLLDDAGYGSGESVTEMHNLYSELREVARNAKAGTNQKNTLAKVANEIADAILEDLGAKQADTAVGRQINEARAFSAALHETFDQGAPGRLLRRTNSGDAAVDPELALKRTAGRGGVEGAVAARQIEAAGVNPELVTDYLRGQFAERSGSKGAVTARDGAAFIARNKALLERYPALKEEIDTAVQAKESADALAARIARRLPELDRQNASITAKFIDGNPDKAVQAVFADARPARAAQSLINAAKKDGTGAALAGVKRAFADNLLRSASQTRAGVNTTSADALLSQFDDPKKLQALRRVFSAQELSRFRVVARELSKAEAAQRGTPGIGDSLSGAKVNRVIEFAARVIAANHGAGLGNGGASLQTAQMASSRMRDMVAGLTADRASRLIAEAVTDPQLMRSLLMDASAPKAEERVINRILPYLIGGVSAGVISDQ
ncbi:MAG: hypothetical protein AAFZ99_06600 [Pseudomonadota bacterium]